MGILEGYLPSGYLPSSALSLRNNLHRTEKVTKSYVLALKMALDADWE